MRSKTIVKPAKNLSGIEKIDKKLIEKQIYTLSYYDFFKEAFKILNPTDDFVDNWHIKVICDELQKECERIIRKEKKEKDIIINIPFRSSKSLITTIIFPVWCWIKDPSLKFMTVSYSASLSEEHATKSRDLIQSEWFQKLFGDRFQIKSDSNKKNHYENDKGGARMATSVGGKATGSGALIVICDDILDPQSAASDAERTTANKFYNETLISRLNTPSVGVRIVVMQRLHEDDIAGQLLEKRRDKHKLIRIPAELTEEVEPKELEQYYQDNLFDPVRFPKEILDEFRSSLGSKQYAGQLLQRPTAAEGEIVKESWIPIVKLKDLPFNLNHIPERLLKIDGVLDKEVKKNVVWDFFVDSSYGSEKNTGDPTGIIAVAKFENTLYVRNAQAKKLDFIDVTNWIQNFCNANGFTSSSRIYIEARASGESIIQYLKRTTKLPVIPLPHSRDSKEVRLHAVTPHIEAGRFKLIEGSWNAEFIHELTAFPNAKHDEFVDLTAYAISKMMGKQQFTWRFN